jgi:hypothetical protein
MKPTLKEYERSRRQLLDLLYTMTDELERNPSLRRRKGFPFDVLESIVNLPLTLFEAVVNRLAMPVIERQLEWLRKRWEKFVG